MSEFLPVVVHVKVHCPVYRVIHKKLGFVELLMTSSLAYLKLPFRGLLAREVS